MDYLLIYLTLTTFAPTLPYYIPPPAANIFRGLQGPYCSRRQDPQCCKGRDDSCTVQINSTQCYCDLFCDRTKFDCCPDFWSLCIYRNKTLPHVCSNDGVDYPQGSVIKKNCNRCECVPDVARRGNAYTWWCTQRVCLLRQYIIDSVNNANFGWRAGNYSHLWGVTLADGVRYKLGTEKPGRLVQRMTPIHMTHDVTLPREFDSRRKWRGLIHGVRDQGNCGASWAFSTTALASDRLAIHSGRRVRPFSPQHLLSCNTRRQNGCRGGHIDRAWWFFRKKGVVTEDCYPYISGHTQTVDSCRIRRRRRRGRCPGRGVYRRDRIYTATPPYRISTDERDIMKEIYTNGPVQATFYVKEDFYSYKRGVYRYSHVTDRDPVAYRSGGYHSVRVIGWGVQSRGATSLKYWLCANSWGRRWGESGYFRIARGNNECEIESFVVGVWASG